MDLLLIGSNVQFWPIFSSLNNIAIQQEQIKIYQPSFLIRQNHLMRKNERIGIMIMKFFNNIGILKSIRPVSVSVLAKNMVNDIFKNSISIQTHRVSIEIEKSENGTFVETFRNFSRDFLVRSWH